MLDPPHISRGITHLLWLLRLNYIRVHVPLMQTGIFGNWQLITQSCVIKSLVKVVAPGKLSEPILVLTALTTYYNLSTGYIGLVIPGALWVLGCIVLTFVPQVNTFHQPFNLEYSPPAFQTTPVHISSDA